MPDEPPKPSSSPPSESPWGRGGRRRGRAWRRRRRRRRAAQRGAPLHPPPPALDDWTAERALLLSRGITLAPGLSDAELDAAERLHGFRFPPDLRAFLRGPGRLHLPNRNIAYDGPSSLR